MIGIKRKIYPFILIKESVIFPNEKASLILNKKEDVSALTSAVHNDHNIVLIFKNNGESRIGVLAKAMQLWYLTPVIAGTAIEGINRAKLIRTFSEKGIQKAEIEIVSAAQEETTELTALARLIFDQFKNLMRLEGRAPAFVEEFQDKYSSAERISNFVSSALRVSFGEKLELIKILDLKKRLDVLQAKITRELNVLETEEKIRHEVRKKISQEQKEMVLRESLKTIEKELGIVGEREEYEELEKKIREAKMPNIAEEKALKELYRLRTMTFASTEAPYIRNYLDWLIELPWNKKNQTDFDLKKAQNILDEDHFGLEKAKERVLEYLAVQKLARGKGGGTIMCFVGPPGTGKTSVGKSIASALGRKFIRMSLGGIRDEAEIRGHRRTYVGALPGRIIQGMRNTGTKNPIFMMDEIDKLGMDFRGDPSAALLEVLDPEQNNSFSDHYLEVPFDLSEVFFITTANILDPIPPALKDRMEVIEFSGYTDLEKFHIAKKFLIPKIVESHGLSSKQFQISDKAILKIISKYTREAGVRNLERRISEIARKAARQFAENAAEKIMITDQKIPDYLGPEEFQITMREEKDEAGIATGLAWTPAGGEIIFIEAAVLPGQGNLILTGHLGDIMQESAKAALSYIRSKYKELDLDKDFYKKSDIHVHVPAGALPKDGPSAGIAIAAALASILTKRKIKKEVALTGEITLSGKILEIGGIKEKVLAARRADVETVIMPKENEKNLPDIPKEVRDELNFKFVSHMDEVLKIALK